MDFILKLQNKIFPDITALSVPQDEGTRIALAKIAHRLKGIMIHRERPNYIDQHLTVVAIENQTTHDKLVRLTDASRTTLLAMNQQYPAAGNSYEGGAYTPLSGSGDIGSVQIGFRALQEAMQKGNIISKNWVENWNRNPHGTTIETSEPGWGGDPDAMSLAQCNTVRIKNDYGYTAGLAMPRATEYPGWHYVQANLKELRIFNHMEIYTKEPQYTPGAFNVSVCNQENCSNDEWVTVYRTNNNTECNQEGDPAEGQCAIRFQFAPIVQASKIRFEYPDASIKARFFWGACITASLEGNYEEQS